MVLLERYMHTAMIDLFEPEEKAILFIDKIFDVKFDLNKENSNGLGLYIVSNILNNYNIMHIAFQ